VGIPQQWERFVTRARALAGQTGPFYGVCCNTSPDGRFDYLTGVEATCAGQLPADFVSVPLAAKRYAVFAHTGHVSTIPKTIDTIWTKWAPDCALKIAHAPCFERYTAEFNSQTGMGGMEIWIPLED
jgi:AraC family transcriptional regulator